MQTSTAAMADNVTLRAGKTKICIPHSPEFRLAAARWSKTVRNRIRWSRFEEQERKHGNLLQKELLDFSNCTLKKLTSLANAGHISVEIPNTDKEVTADFNRYPWEYALSAATKNIRTKKRLAVVRSIGHAELSDQSIDTVLYVQITPVDSKRKVNFESEKMLVKEHFERQKKTKEQQPWTLTCLTNPTKQDLFTYISSNSPDIIHIAGISTAAARHIFDIERPLPNGLLSSSPVDSDQIIEYQELAGILCGAAEKKPVLIFANLLRTSTLFSAACLANGAGSVISISNHIDSTIIYKFIASFYKGWRDAKFESLLTGFKDAYLELASGSGELRGTALVLNSASPLIDNDTWPGKTESEHADLETEPDVIDSIEKARSAISVEVNPESALNYATLHNAQNNQGCLFKQFDISNRTDVEALGIHVEVELHFGSERFPYRQSFIVEANTTRPIRKQVQVPLTAALIREVRESVKTSLYVNVTYLDFSVYEHTYDVVLLAANEWNDSRNDGVWLPSFVLPRDPAIEDVVTKATRYLKAILDNPSAGFSGYVMPDRDKAKPMKSVDRQVSAIWSTLLYEYSIDYISPPPTYTKRSQRLRTPSQVIRSKSGTCIDLVLLIAACLEHIDIHAAVVVLKGHAQLAYWSNEQAHEKFVSGIDLITNDVGSTCTPMSEQVTKLDEEPIAPWIMTNPDEMLSLVRQKELIIVESVQLTKKTGFQQSKVPLMFWNQVKKNAFRALVDVQLARKLQITPLPLIDSI